MGKVNVAEKLSLPTEAEIWGALSAKIPDEIGSDGYKAVRREARELAQADSWAQLREWAAQTNADACAAMGHTTALRAMAEGGILAA